MQKIPRCIDNRVAAANREKRQPDIYRPTANQIGIFFRAAIKTRLLKAFEFAGIFMASQPAQSHDRTEKLTLHLLGLAAEKIVPLLIAAI